MTLRKTADDWYRIEAKAGERRAEICILEQIGENFWTGEGMTAKKFSKELQALDVDTIDLHINSPGGSVFDGQTIYTQLRNHRALVNVHIDGLAASIASVIAMAGDTVIMPRNALMMIHDPTGYAMGTAEDMRKTAGALDKVKGTIIAAYQDKTGLPDDQLAEMMSDETWMTAAEAVELGFADKIIAPVNMIACASFGLLANFQKIPNQLVSAQNSTSWGNAMTMRKQRTVQPTHAVNIEDTILAEWNDPAIQAEFYGNFGTYRAFRLAEERGLVRMAGKGVRQ